MRSSIIACLFTIILPSLHAWVPHIITKGNKFFNAETGVEFRIKGMAYYPRPNDGEMSTVANYDWAADEHENVWKPHLAILQDLGVNTIRLYSVDPSKSHDKFMCACSEAGIYVLIGMVAPCKDCAIMDAVPPACYPPALFTRMQMVYNAFAVYDNTLGFSIGNENNLQNENNGKKDGTGTAPCVKALLRDVRRYAASCAGSLRPVPIGLDIADIPPRKQWIEYYDCSVDNEEASRAEWIGFNPYVECDPVTTTTYQQSHGLINLMKEYAATNYARPLLFGEFGCNLGKNTIDGWENQRSFYDAKWMNEEKEMTSEIVGGNVFEFVTERLNVVSKKLNKKADPGKFGVGYFTPDNCDHDTIPCIFTPYPEFKNLKKAYTTTKPSTLTMSSFTPSNTGILQCPKTLSTELPVMPNVASLACTALQPTCNGKKANAFKHDGSKAVPLGKKKTPTNEAGETPVASNQTDSSASGNGGSTSKVRSTTSSTGTIKWNSIVVAIVVVGASILLIL